jgi:sarcosine oxidase subunit delta
MLLLVCPNCGLRNVAEFRYGGEVNVRPKLPLGTADTDWQEYIYMRRNVAGVQKEWWYHRAGCGSWFLAERHTKTNVVAKSYFWRASGTEVEETDRGSSP